MEFREGHTVGIDLGTTFSTLAHLGEDGTPTPIKNEEGADETPSLVLLAESGHVVVGPNPMRAAMENPENVVDRVKRHMGESRDEYKRTFDGKPITPEFLSALVLKKVCKDAEKDLGNIGNAVITVPYYFNDVRRKATQDAGRIAGLNVIDIINEPTAATLTYAWQCKRLGVSESGESDPKDILVYDLGGGTFDVTLIRFTPTHFQVLATDGDVHLGGVDWNDRLLEYVADKFKEKHGIELRESPEASQLLLYECDQAKVVLSEKTETTINCRHQGKSMELELTRKEFEDMTADFLQRTIDTAHLVLNQAEMSADDLEAIVLVGGSTLMPMVPERIRSAFGGDVYSALSPHTAVAQGAAIHAAILEAKYRGEESDLAAKLRKMLSQIKQENVNSHGLGVVARNPKTDQEVNYVMIPRNSTLPLEARHTFVTSQDDQQRVHVKVIQGEAPDPTACSLIGDCRITDLPKGLPKGSPIDVIYSFDKAGRVQVRAEDKTNGRVASIEIERSGGLTDEQIDVFSKLANEYKID